MSAQRLNTIEEARIIDGFGRKQLVVGEGRGSAVKTLHDRESGPGVIHKRSHSRNLFKIVVRRGVQQSLGVGLAGRDRGP